MGPDERRRRRYLVAAAGAVALVILLISRGCPSSPADETRAPRASTRSAGPADGASNPDPRSSAAAAVDFATAPQRWLYLSDEDVEAAVRDIAAPDRAEDLAAAVVEDVREAREGLSASSGPVWWVVRPLAFHLEEVTAERATVEVWVVTVLSARDVAAPQAEWRTIDLDLVWIDGAWKVDAIRDTPGPTPMLGPRDRPWDAVPFDEALDGFERLGGEEVR